MIFEICLVLFMALLTGFMFWLIATVGKKP